MAKTCASTPPSTPSLRSNAEKAPVQPIGYTSLSMLASLQSCPRRNCPHRIEMMGFAKINNNEILFAPASALYLAAASTANHASIQQKPPSTLPKNGESRRDSVGFCRLGLCNIGLS